jgi:hypothetical protein
MLGLLMVSYSAFPVTSCPVDKQICAGISDAHLNGGCFLRAGALPHGLSSARPHVCQPIHLPFPKTAVTEQKLTHSEDKSNTTSVLKLQ